MTTDNASQQLITATTDYSKGVKNAPKSYIQLEGQLQHIVATSNLALEPRLSIDPPHLPTTLTLILVPLNGVFSHQPGACLATLKAMENILRPQPLQLPIIRKIPSAPED
ncbi:hypothetical protein PAXINDRAFT_104015 [Paxillus involutus ATCC 200175]|uniref:Uncharacterized protein n=1 Tax=Paxillus involutus ATCC 200175 TaxID=664439 RepID=A0A0C9T043_PAXIN|nr:hypothetical protein PAXINDRAFT_104015 [Paxillus involutus ATCC 200175]